MQEANGNTILTHAGGKVIVVGVTGMSLSNGMALTGARAGAPNWSVLLVVTAEPAAALDLGAHDLQPLGGLGAFEHQPLRPFDFLFA